MMSKGSWTGLPAMLVPTIVGVVLPHEQLM